MWRAGPSRKWAKCKAPITAKSCAVLLQWQTRLQASMDQTAWYRHESLSTNYGRSDERTTICTSGSEILEKRITQKCFAQMGWSSWIPAGALWMSSWNPSRWWESRVWWWSWVTVVGWWRWECSHARHSAQKTWRYWSHKCSNHSSKGGTLPTAKLHVWSLEADENYSAWNQLQL